MKRRGTIKQLLTAGVGLVALPSWALSWTREDLPMHHSFLDEMQQEILRHLVDTILPAGQDNIGGVSEGVDAFLVRLFDQCYEADVQSEVGHQLMALDARANSYYGQSFSRCTQAEREILFLQCAVADDAGSRDFYDLIKSEAIRGFRTSRKVLMRFYDYRVAPGHYDGFKPLEKQ